ncbi:hypothetical protein V8G54_033518 [Vigna mungo]|uniref:Uncharacterized protein n=1 Tax=Vigna mungo TaxID=3915 RepID=A0AAQ3MP26_VIGMU
MTNIMVNEDDNNIHELNSEEWMKMIENTLNEEKDPLSVGDILGEVYHELSKLSPSQVFYIHHFSLFWILGFNHIFLLHAPTSMNPSLDHSPDSVTLVANHIQSYGENLFVDIHDQGVAFAYSHAPTPSGVVPATNNTQLPSPHNITLSHHAESDWVQMSNNSNHLYSYKLKSHHKRYERWTEDEHRLFLLGLIACGEGDWKGISELYVVSKSPSQVASHAQKYKIHQKASTKNKKRKSIHEVSIEPSKHALPTYIMSLDETSSKDDVLNCANHMESCNNSIVAVPRKKWKHWTEDEHKLFVLGYAKYQENWKEVSKNFVPSKTPTQIASHAQKYFLRQNISENNRKRKSIHDITL